MKINYKITTIILAIIIIGTFLFNNYKSNNTNSHKMPDGSIMLNDHMSMGSMMMDMTDGMKGKNGSTLEKTFLEEMIIHHQGAVDMANMLLKDKTIKPELREFANKIISAQNPEIEQMKAWLKGY